MTLAPVVVWVSYSGDPLTWIHDFHSWVVTFSVADHENLQIGTPYWVVIPADAAQGILVDVPDDDDLLLTTWIQVWGLAFLAHLLCISSSIRRSTYVLPMYR